MIQTAETLEQYFAEARRQIDAALSAYLELGPDCPQLLAEAMRHSVLAPAKRLRPVLVLMACEACGGDLARAMPAACAVELVHTYSLIHDDLPAMDDDDLRRGRPTCHKVYGEAMAILAGDALLARAFEILARDIEPAQTAARCVATLAEAAGPTRLVAGQADDLQPGESDDRLKLLEAIHARKTGALLCASLELGALCAGADDAQRSALAAYGRRLGMVFQITDDLLDVRGEEQALGKRVGKDADRGKLTFPGLLGVEASLQEATALTAEACEQLAPLAPAAERLKALAHYVLERDR